MAAGEEEADDKIEDEGQDTVHEGAEDADGAAEGATAAGEEAAEEAEGEGADVPVEGDTSMQGARKEDGQEDPEGAAGQEPAEAEGDKAELTPKKKKAVKRVIKPAQAGKGGAGGKPKTRSQSDQAAAGKRSKPAKIEFPPAKENPK